MKLLLEANHLTLKSGDITLVDDIHLDIREGETLALVGESGSGKSLTALALMGLLPRSVRRERTTRITFEGEKISDLTDDGMRHYRGAKMAMIFQEPMTALNPLHTIGKQIAESLRLHQPIADTDLRHRIEELLTQVGLENLSTRLSAYPHELSGGQRQRVMIAMAIANKPKLLIADEPTTALDVTIQQQIMTLLESLQKDLGMALLLITHDLPLVKRVADRVAVMKEGKIVEQSPSGALFKKPQHDYTKFLLGAAPKGDNTNPVSDHLLLKADELSVRFPAKKDFFGRVTQFSTAVDKATLTLNKGETLGIVGESGSGKTTLALALLRLIRSQGAITFHDRRLDPLNTQSLRPLRKQMQFVFQDPYASLNPRMTIGDIVSEGIRLHRIASTEEGIRLMAGDILKEVGLSDDMLPRYPHEFSGGQRQRINIARALAVQPDLLVLDEPTSALDLATQTQIIDLLRKLQHDRGLSYIFITHDLRVMKAISHRILVMKEGHIVEHAPTPELFTHPKQPYTRALIDAAML